MVSLYSTWWVKPEYVNDMQASLNKLVSMVKEGEEGTLMYLVHSPIYDFPKASKEQRQWVSEPMIRPGTLVFVEKYLNWSAFFQHVKGDAFTTFLSENKDKFVEGHDRNPFIQVVFMEEEIGFVRSGVGHEGTGDK